MRAADAPLLRSPRGAREAFEASDGGWQLCHRAEPPRQDQAYGEYVLVGPAPGRAPLSLSVAYRAGLSQEPKFFVIAGRAASPNLVRGVRQCDMEWVAPVCAPGL